MNLRSCWRKSLSSRPSWSRILVRNFLFPKGNNVPVLSLASWPSAKELELDDSQYKAIQMALTKEFAVIQGPPGTGKTYIGLKVSENLKIGPGRHSGFLRANPLLQM